MIYYRSFITPGIFTEWTRMGLKQKGQTRRSGRGQAPALDNFLKAASFVGPTNLRSRRLSTKHGGVVSR